MEPAVEALPDGLLAARQCSRGVLGDLRGQLPRAGQHGVARQHLTHQADLLGALGAHALRPAEEGHPQHLLQRDAPGQAHRFEARDEAHLDVGVEEGGVLGRHDEVAVGDEVEAPAAHHAVHRGDDGLPATIVDGREEVVEGLARLALERFGGFSRRAGGHVGHVHAGAERLLSRTRDDDADHVGIALDGRPGLAQLHGHAHIEAVVHVGSVEGERGDAVGHVVEEGFEVHLSPAPGWRCHTRWDGRRCCG